MRPPTTALAIGDTPLFFIVGALCIVIGAALAFDVGGAARRWVRSSADAPPAGPRLPFGPWHTRRGPATVRAARWQGAAIVVWGLVLLWMFRP